jgi:hypothetical protein
MNSHQNLQTLFRNAIQAIISKISQDYNLSVSEITSKIGFPAITDDLESSIKSYCETLVPPIQVQSVPEKPKKIIKKKVVTTETVASIADTVIVPETIIKKPKRVLKKKAVLPETKVATVADIGDPSVSAVSAVLEPSVVPEKPKRVLKKKAAPIETAVAAVVTDAPVLVETKLSTPPVKDIVEPEVEEIKLKPKKIMLKKPVLESKKNVEEPEYGEDVEQVEIYETFQTYEEDSLEPREINGVKYYVDTSGYIYDFENQDLVGKLNQSGDRMIVLNDFSPMSD